MRFSKLCGEFVASQPCGFIHLASGWMGRISAESRKTIETENHAKSPSEFRSAYPPRIPRCLSQDVKQLGFRFHIIVDVRPSTSPRWSLSRSRAQPSARRARVIADWPAWCWCSRREREKHAPEGRHSPCQTTEGASAYARTSSRHCHQPQDQIA